MGWEHYWSSIRATGVGGDVLWDAGDLGEMQAYLRVMRTHLDTSLPIIDIGCGNGRFTRQLVPVFGSVVGIDLSPSAIAVANSESTDSSVVEFRSMDAIVPGATNVLASEWAPANIFIRGVFHILDPSARVELARNLLSLTVPGVGLSCRDRLPRERTGIRGEPRRHAKIDSWTAGTCDKGPSTAGTLRSGRAPAEL